MGNDNTNEFIGSVEIPSKESGLLATTSNKPLEDSFSEWNLRLLQSFFSEANKGEEVFLRVDKDFLDLIGQDIGGDAGFLEAVRAGPAWLDEYSSFVKRILTLINQRTQKKIFSRNYKNPSDFDPVYRDLSAPAYLPYLAALVRNASEHPRYYDGLQADLKLRHRFGINEMKEIEVAWEDLQAWTESCGGEFGYFKLRRLGGYPLIGVPRSQSILKVSDIENLTHVFIQAEVRAGQELSDDLITRILNEALAADRLFTNGFKEALQSPEFHPPIRGAIGAAYSDWDGTRPHKDSFSSSTQHSSSLSGIQKFNLGLSLAVVQQNPLEVSPCWRIDAIRDSGSFELAYAHYKWGGQFYGTEGASSTQSKEKIVDFWKVLESAGSENIQFDMRYFVDQDTEPTTLKLQLGRQLLWVLNPAHSSLTGDLELKEGELPASGVSFLLAPPYNVSALQGYLEREKPAYERVSALGLPDDWMLICLSECSSLTQDQRLLPDGEAQARPSPRSIRFVGGRSIRRGYSRMYLFYDLPMIELDAQEGSYIEHPEGVSLDEESLLAHPVSYNEIALKPLRRFKVKLSNSNSASYEFRVIAADGSCVGQAKLRISGLSGDVVEVEHAFSVDNIGRALRSNEGLIGTILPISTNEAYLPAAKLSNQNLNYSTLALKIEHGDLSVGIHEQFLDALAQSGSFDYGVARDLLRRLMLSACVKNEPVFILLDLCRRGHLEISKTNKGHIARIYSVPPTLYSLPVLHDNRPVWGVAGTLRLAHWEAIAQELKAWAVHKLTHDADALEPWLLLINEETEALSMCNQLGFKFVKTPCVSIASWSADLDVFRNEAFRNTSPTLGAASNYAEKLNASSGLFTLNPRGEILELWRVQDLDAGWGSRLYVLADSGKYAFVSDSRWGIWLALYEFSKWVSTYPGMEGVHPLPITYQASNETVWLPARISPPAILERALVLCSGNSPEIISFKKHISDVVKDRVLLSLSVDSSPLLSISSIYSDMAEGRWLAYRCVPEHVARIVADKLGAVLDVI